MTRRSRATCLLAALCFARPALAQSVSLDEKAQPAPPPPPKPVPVTVRVPVVPPRAISTPVAYPVGQLGDHEVVLELTISKEGAVTAAAAISGEAAVAATAIEASRSWRFEPATRAGSAVAAKIRFAVHFEPPPVLEATPAEPPNAPPVSLHAATAPAASPRKMREILVIGKREPLRHTLGHADVHDLPGAFGDPYRAIEALPGVVPIVSGLPYFYVRGAPPGNVGYFFDGIPVPYLYHFAAGPGVLQPAFVDHVDLYPGAYPARYGRFAGAIVAGEMAPPSYRFHGEASIRLIDSGAVIEAPFAGGRGSAMLGGRFSYTAAVLSKARSDSDEHDKLSPRCRLPHPRQLQPA